ncbi:DUF4209 domain-containing protein [Chitinophaga defluvii]|uniref:DUF4209 domain-containing protein n=1 Tax=Chitinophaga defluvii TaxID=3163343 RepID=A0ABV2T1F2_9BACT
MVPTALFKDILASFEQRPLRPLQETEVYNLLQKQIPESYGELTIQEKAELIAFSFLEPSKNKVQELGFYFIPLSITKNEAGTIVESPSVSMVTRDTITYWSTRLEQTDHPVLAARYAGLIYDMSLYVTGSKPQFSIAKKYVESLLDLIDQKLYKISTQTICKVGRALEVSLNLSNPDLIERCKAGILKLEEEIAIPDKPGLWGFPYDLLIGGKKKLVSKMEETAIVKKLEDRFDNMLMVNTWCAERAAKRLMNYYFGNKQPQEIKRILSGLETSYDNTTNGLAIFHQSHSAEQLYQFSKQFQLNEEADFYLKKLRMFSKGADKDLKSTSAEISIPKDKIDKYINQILEGDNSETIFVRIIESCTPRVEEAKEELERLSKVAPFQFILSRDLLDKKGRRVARIPPISDDFFSHLILHLSNSIRIGTIFLHFIFEEAITRGILTIHELMKFIDKSCIIEKDRLPIFQKGFEAYFAGDYIVAIHLLIPQFEEAIRNLVEMNGGSVIIQKEDAFNLKTFDHLLKDEIITDIFGEDKSLYFKTLFTDKRGWNIRNHVAHGMLDVAHFLNKQNIDRIMHAILCLGMVRLKESQIEF